MAVVAELLLTLLHADPELLGALVRVREKHIVVHPDKRKRYITEIVLAEQEKTVERDFLNSLVHKLIYSAGIIVRMRPWLNPIFRCLRAPSRAAREQ